LTGRSWKKLQPEEKLESDLMQSEKVAALDLMQSEKINSTSKRSS
jgi:hypothetical protein